LLLKKVIIKMMQKEKIKLLRAWRKNPFDRLSISEIMKLSGKTTKPWVFNSLNLLTRYKFLILEKKGNINLYSLNLNNPFLIQTLQYLEAQANLSFPKLEVISETVNEVPIKNYCLLVFGSYAENKQKDVSDLDMCFLIEDKYTEKKIRPYFNGIKQNYQVNIDEHYVTFRDFVRMLLRDEENLGKQIFRKHILFFNAEIYYQLVKEAYKNGFRP